MFDSLNLGDRANRTLKIIEAELAFPSKFDAQENGHPKPQRGGVETQSAISEDARLFQTPDPPPHGGLAQTQAAPQNSGILPRVL